MNGESFKSFLDGDINVVGIDIYIKTSKKSDEESELFLLKSIKKEEIKEETEIISKPQEKIISILKSFKEKELRCYDSHKSRDEIFYLNLSDLNQMEDLNSLIKEIYEVNHQFGEYEEYGKTIKMLIVKIITEPKHQILFFIKYNYNDIAKKNFILEFCGAGKFNFSNAKILILNFFPSGILFDDELLIVNGYINSLFDFDIFHEKYIKANEVKIKNVFHGGVETFSTKKHSFYMARGIMTGGLDKYLDLDSTEKEEKIAKFKDGYKAKFGNDINMALRDDKIVMDNCSSKEKEEIIKCLTNKSAFKLITDELTTSLD